MKSVRSYALDLLCTTLILCGCDNRKYAVEQIPFEGDAWLKAAPVEGHRTVRSQMVEDLLASRRLKGLTEQQVLALLGPPLTNAQSWGVSSQWTLVYLLGTERGGAYSLDDEFLVFRFNDSNVVAEVRTVVN